LADTFSAKFGKWEKRKIVSQRLHRVTATPHPFHTNNRHASARSGETSRDIKPRFQKEKKRNDDSKTNLENQLLLNLNLNAKRETPPPRLELGTS
jgi:hypothetical protein